MITVYHGGTSVISAPLVHVGRNNLDFGKGFYVTDIREQAVSWSRRAANEGKPQWLNIYQLDDEVVKAKYRYMRFPAYDKDWLDFIVNCRKGSNVWRDYDIIEGGVADDRVIDTVNLYMLDILPADLAIERLAQHKPNNQICIINQEIIENHFKFIHAEALNKEAQQQNVHL
jgi:hypothetical protein